GVAIAANTPSNGGGTITSYSVTPALPAGLALNTGTGVISGTPTAATAQATYTVTGSNAAGQTTASLSITVTASVQPPTGLAYATNPATYPVGAAITPNAPTNGGGAITSYSVSPALPAGLTLDAASGIVAGTPTAATTQATYTVTGTNAAGSTSVGLVLTVNAVSGPPAGLRYATNPASYVTGTAITPNAPSSTGGTITSYAVTPTLPDGLALHPTTGVISGTPTTAVPQAVYVVTGTNPQGSTTANVSITVTAAPVPPAALTYAQNPVTYPVGQAITPNRPSSTGGAITSYAVVPALPAGLVLDTATGVVSGTPTAATAIASYVVTGTNAAGSTSVALSITVTSAPVPPAGLAYSDPAPTYSAGTAIFPNTPSSTGGAIAAYSVAPSLPAGLLLDPATGVITGTPTTPTAAATYVVTGSNAAGSTTASLLLTVAGPPVITAHPASASVVPPATASFTVSATGSGVLTYQWQRNGTIIPGAVDATYVTPATAGSDNGAQYRVVVTDDFGGMVTSNAATLTVQGFSFTGSMTAAREAHSATLLANGKVLVAGGSDGGRTLSSAELFDPATGTFTATGSMAVARQQHQAIRLSDGKVLVVGGFANGTGTLASAEVYDPATGTFAAANGPMAERRQDFVATLLLDGTVLVAGGMRSATPSDFYLATAEVYDPATGLFSATGSMTAARAAPVGVPTAAGFLVAGGYSGTAYLASADVYDATARTFSAATTAMTYSSWNGSAVLLGDGSVLLAGGQSGFATLASANTFVPAGQLFAATGSMGTARSAFSLSSLPSGKMLAAGGTDGQSALSSAEFYDPTAGTWATATAQGLVAARYRFQATELQDGRVLVTGGHAGAAVLRTAEVWTNVP
ncbi:MAG TPA: putative Ig domain-containing protein, partial [Anaeromyxobacteraceae bacterium]|nr:putative Ig domain-containing protein [Anaeromyxobacteraceae bacterium]